MGIKPRFNIAVLPGDGIGEEIMRAAEQVLAAVETKIGVRFPLNYQKAGAQHYLDTGVALPESVLRVCDEADAILFGAMGLPHVRSKDGTEIVPQLDLRFHFDLYAGIRPIRTFKGLPSPLSNPKAAEIDLVLIRENTEGLFYASGRADVRGEPGVESEVFDTMKISRKGTERICQYAFVIAERRAAMKGRPGSLSGILCLRHNMSKERNMYAKQEEGRYRGRYGVAADSAGMA